MKAETSAYLAKARVDLDDANIIASVGLAKAAAPTAYCAASHAAEALIMERTGKIAKTHSGVQTLLGQLRPAVDKRFLTFLGQAYVFKQISDYGLDQETIVTLDEARDAIAEAETMIEDVTAMLEA